MEEIKYEVATTGQCITECPHKQNDLIGYLKVGSYGCGGCRYSKGKHKVLHIVNCGFKDE